MGMEVKIKIKQGVIVEQKGKNLVFKKGSVTLERELFHPLIGVKVGAGEIILSSKVETRRLKALINTFESHIINLMNGCDKPYVYKMKICSSHFPMSVKVEGAKVVISNFIGEKTPRHARIIGASKVEVGKDGVIVITNPNIESAGLTAGALENATRVTYRDRRVLQDGIFIIERPSKK
jgi:large subunit ribosomal protein L6